MRVASFNVLADAYTGYGDYSHADPALMEPGARLEHLVRQINEFNADVIGLQEADKVLAEAFTDDSSWQTLWTPKGRQKPDGCLTLVKQGLRINDHREFWYDDGSGHVYQITTIGQLAVANTHIKWAPSDDPRHIGVSQTHELLTRIGERSPAVILADCNDRPGGPVRAMVEEAGFNNVSGDRPTAIVNGEVVAIDLLAVRGIQARYIESGHDVRAIPSANCASDHIPLIAEFEAN